MALISAVGAETLNFQEKSVEKDLKYRIFFGVFFDGTSNNMIQGSTARRIRSSHAKDGSSGIERLTKHGWLKDGRHKYEQELVTEDELKDIEKAIQAGSFKDGYKNFFGKRGEYKGKDGGFSNVAILFSKYRGAVAGETTDENNNTVKTLVYKIYVEGSGANDIKQWNTGIDARGLGFGVGKTGVVALVSKAIMAVCTRLSVFNGHENNVELNFDVFGFSRGAACARLFSYMVRRGKDEKLEKREKEFKKYYCKTLFGEERLSFLDEYSYNEKQNTFGTKKVCFLGIYDTVVSIGMLRRKKDTTIQNASNKFNNDNNVINPLRSGFALDRDFDENLHDLNVAEYGMFSPQLGVPTFHICAMDEFRENFALTDVGEEVPENSLEIFLPGCHSDIGGGYICNNEEKIVLNKYPTFSLEGLPLIKSKEGQAQMYIKFPQNETGIFSPLKLDTIRFLGWLPQKNEVNNSDWWKIFERKSPLMHNKAKKDFSNKAEDSVCRVQGGEYNDKEGKIGAYEWWDRGDKIGWKRTVPSFFSNVPLHLMAERASCITGRSVFYNDGKSYTDGGDFWEKGYYDIPKGLNVFYNYVKNKIDIKNDKGFREWIFPKDDYSSDDYRTLRLFYLHFTSEQKLGISRLWDVQNATNVRNYYNVISRIVYHGNKEDSGNMHYMFNYNAGIRGSFDKNHLC